MGFWTQFATFLVLVLGGLTIAWLVFKDSRPSIRERIFTGLVSTIVIMVGLWLLTSGFFIKPESLGQEIVLVVGGTLLLSALGATIAIIMYAKANKKKRR
jgi:hypothetical protein